MYDDDDEYDEEEEDNEINEAQEAENARRVTAEGTRGAEERAYYDGIAKQEDDRHNAMRKDKQRRTLLVGEARQKLRHKEAEVRALEEKIRIEQDRITLDKKRLYRKNAKDIVDGTPIEPTPQAPEHIEIKNTPILLKDVDRSELDEEFSIEVAEMHIKQLTEEKKELERVTGEMRAKLNEDERALSQLEHQIARM